jgi:hypothetical protein
MDKLSKAYTSIINNEERIKFEKKCEDMGITTTDAIKLFIRAFPGMDSHDTARMYRLVFPDMPR